MVGKVDSCIELRNALVCQPESTIEVVLLLEEGNDNLTTNNVLGGYGAILNNEKLRATLANEVVTLFSLVCGSRSVGLGGKSRFVVQQFERKSRTVARVSLAFESQALGSNDEVEVVNTLALNTLLEEEVVHSVVVGCGIFAPEVVKRGLFGTSREGKQSRSSNQK